MAGADIKEAADTARRKYLARPDHKNTVGDNELLYLFLKELEFLFRKHEDINKQKFGFNLSRAAAQVKSCKDKITTSQELNSVKYIGPVVVRFVKEALWDTRFQDSQEKGDLHAEDENIESGTVSNSQGVGTNKRKRQMPLLQSNSLQSKGNKVYIPQYGSANYAFLVVMYQQLRQHNQQEFGKDELMRLAENSGLATKSIYGDKMRNINYDGWSCIRGMLQKEPPLIQMRGCPLKCNLTGAGIELAEQLYAQAALQGKVPMLEQPKNDTGNNSSNASRKNQRKSGKLLSDVDTNTKTSEKQSRKRSSQTNNSTTEKEQVFEVGTSQQSNQQKTEIGEDNEEEAEWVKNDVSIPDQEPLKLKPATEEAVIRLPPLEPQENFEDLYDIILVIDQREQFSKGKANRTQALEQHMQRWIPQGIQTEIRTLPIGDGLWIARNRYNGQEYVLDYIVERKNVEDLYGSIKDRRYEIQKYGLKRCGLPYVFYLVEGDPDLVDGNLAIKTAAVATEILDGFTVLRTADIAATFQTYTRLTNAITSLCRTYAGAQQSSSDSCLLTYKQLSDNVAAVKKSTTKETWGLMLTAIPGVGKRAASAIIERYPTPVKFYQAFSSIPCSQESVKIIASIKAGQKAIGESAARSVYQALIA